MKYKISVACIEDLNQLSVHSFQLINKLRNVFEDKDAWIVAICLGDYDEETLRSLYCYGADEVVYCEMKMPDKARTIHNAIKMILELTPDLVILPSCDWGRFVASELSIEAEAGLIADCIDIELSEIDDNEEVVFSRAAINATVIAKIICINSSMRICTFKKNAYVVNEFYESDKLDIRYWKDSKINDISESVQVIDRVICEQKDKTKQLENAKIVFGFGRGVKCKETLALIKKIADIYNAVIVGTRAVVEDGLIGKDYQVGQSGINITPDIYIAIGISGASQHIVGIKNSKKIIAINNDNNAPIFAYADYIIVDDCVSVLNALWGHLKENM